jgi:AcrR family transcriptional regulator
MRIVYDGVVAKERPASVKDRILESAIEEFSSLGYHRSSLRRISELSHATKPMIYYHFKGKDGLYAAVVGHQLGLLEQRLRDSISQKRDVRGRLETFANLYLTCFLEDFPVLAVGLRELPTLPAPVFAEIAATHGTMVVAILKRILRDGEAAGELRPLDVDNCARAIIGIMHYYIRGSGLDDAAAIVAATEQITGYYAAGLLSHDA